MAALSAVVPTLLTYVLSFVYLGIYWNNHHHMLHMTEHVNGAILWANLHLLFWLSLVPFVTSWMGNTHLRRTSNCRVRSRVPLSGGGIHYSPGDYHRATGTGLQIGGGR